MNTRVMQLGLVVTAALMSAQTVVGQSVNAVGGRLVADHYLLGSAMNGVGGSLTLPTPMRRLDVQVAYDRYAGTSMRVGTPCAGLAEPFSCFKEPIHDRSTLYLFSVGPTFKLIRTPEFFLSVLGQVQGGGVSSESYGLQSTRVLGVNNTLWGVSGGLSAGWRPSPTGPIVFQAATTAGRLGTGNRYTGSDAYAPFDGQSIRTHRMSVGISYLITNRY